MRSTFRHRGVDLAGCLIKHATIVTAILWLLRIKDSASAFTLSQSQLRSHAHPLSSLVLSQHSYSSILGHGVEGNDIDGRNADAGKAFSADTELAMPQGLRTEDTGIPGSWRGQISVQELSTNLKHLPPTSCSALMTKASACPRSSIHPNYNYHIIPPAVTIIRH